MTMGLGGLIGAGLGALGGVAGWAAGTGKNRNASPTFGESKQYDPNASTLANTTMGQQYGSMGEKAQGREGVQLDNQLGNETRGAGMDALGMMREAAQGNRPSVAQQQMQQGMDKAVASQQAMAAGARGAQALGQAQYNAGANTAQIQQATNAASGQLRAQEMAQALGQYGQQGLGMRSQDEARALAQAELFARQRAMNDQFQLGMVGQQNQANIAQMGAMGNQQGMLAGSFDRAMGYNAQRDAANAANEWNYYKAIMGGIQGGMQGGGPGMGGLGG